MSKLKIQRLTEYLVNRLKEEGFVVQKYEAYSSNSVYLKLDYGVCNSIRISDHMGKRHLKYRYNLLLNVTKYRKAHDIYERHFYPPDMVDRMIQDITLAKRLKIESYGDLNYKLFMQNNFKKNHMNDSGFWSQAVEV